MLYLTFPNKIRIDGKTPEINLIVILVSTVAWVALDARYSFPDNGTIAAGIPVANLVQVSITPPH